MSHINFDKQDGKKRGWKGFYLALAICLVAVGGVAVATFLSTPGLSKTESGETPTTAPSKPVGQVVTNVPDTRTTATTAAPTTTVPPVVVPTTTGKADLFILPLTNEVLCSYSDGQPVYSKTMKDWRVHNGVDFKGTKGQEVKALADGTVTAIDDDTLWGQTITIDHGFGIQSKYCGVASDTLKKGQALKVGDTVGVLADIPCEVDDGPHLHLEILVNGEYVNPVEAIGRDVKNAAS